MVAPRETAELAEQLSAETVAALLALFVRIVVGADFRLNCLMSSHLTITQITPCENSFSEQQRVKDAVCS